MPLKALFDYDRLLFAGVPIYMQNGVDYIVTTETMKVALRAAARRRGLRIHLVEIYPYDGVLFQTYISKNGRPVLPLFKLDGITKENHKFLFCLRDDCENRLRPVNQITGLCNVHSES